jgi:hypothetical protein
MKGRWLPGLLLLALAWIALEPAAWTSRTARGRLAAVTTPDPSVQQMIAQVQSSTLYAYDGGLSGMRPVIVGGQPYTLTTRHTGLSGALTPILMADGMSVSDHSRFWQQGYPAILAIEDNVDDFNANYHTPFAPYHAAEP